MPVHWVLLVERDPALREWSPLLLQVVSQGLRRIQEQQASPNKGRRPSRLEDFSFFLTLIGASSIVDLV